jgi:hypothetical protein
MMDSARVQVYKSGDEVEVFSHLGLCPPEPATRTVQPAANAP